MSPKRPEFSLPSTKPAEGAAAKTEWVYRSDQPEADPVVTTASEPAALVATDVSDEAIIGRYAGYASWAGIIPVPWLDVVTVGGLQLRMLSELCGQRGVSFDDEIGRSLISAMVGTYGATRLACQVGRSLLKAVPMVGWIGTSMAMSAMAYGATWAIGKVFAMHLANGGTLLDVDMPSMRARYQDELSAVR